jgi:hypothetical protein
MYSLPKFKNGTDRRNGESEEIMVILEAIWI